MRLAAKIGPALRSVQARIHIDARRYPWLQTIVIVLTSGLVFGIVFSLSISTFLRDDLSVCWPVAGIQAAALLRIPRRYWISVIAGMIISQVILEWWEPMDEILVDTFADAVEVGLAAFCLPALNGLPEWIKQPRLLQRFLLWPTILGPALTGLPVAAVFAHELHVTFWSYWERWFAGDMLGIVLWLPLGVVLMSRETYALFQWKQLPRTLGLLGALWATGGFIFHIKPTPLAFAFMPLFLLIALKLGFSGSAIAVNVLCIISATGTLQHLGPFGFIQEPFSVTALQVFLASAMLMSFPISIILLQRDDFERESKAAYARMEQLAICDGLTGLANRRRFDTVFAEEWRRAMRDRQPLAVMMIDVDCFKLYNDVYGHLAGDDCLRQIGDSIKNTLKRAGDLSARYGGEEFVVLMPRTDVHGVIEVAETIRLQVEALHLEHERNPHQIVTISIGCASLIPNPSILPETLLEAADQLLYAAKQGGRNRVATHLPTAARPSTMSRAS